MTTPNWLKHVPYSWLVMALAFIAQTGANITTHGFPVFYPFIQEELALSRAQVGLITSGLLGGGIATAFLGGWLADVLGVKKVMVIVLFLMAGLMGMFPIASSFSMILILATLIGAARGPAIPAATRVIMDWIPRKTRGFTMNLTMTGSPLGGAFSAAILPALALSAGWRVSALSLAALILTTALLFLIFYRDAFSNNKVTTRMSLVTLRTLIKNKTLIIATVWGSILSGLFVILLTYLILYLIEEINLTPIAAGGYLAVAQVSSIIARIFWGAISDFVFGTRRIIVLGILGFIASAGFAGISFISSYTAQPILMFLVITLGITIMSWPGVFNTLIGELAEKTQIGITQGATSTIMRVSMVGLPPLFGLLVDITHSYSAAWIAASAATALATASFVVLGKETQR